MCRRLYLQPELVALNFFTIALTLSQVSRYHARAATLVTRPGQLVSELRLVVCLGLSPVAPFNEYVTSNQHSRAL